MSTIILICGLPGTGKSTLAEAIAKQLNLPLFSKDTLEASLVEHGVMTTDQLNGVGYTLLKNLVDDHEARGLSVVVDFIADRDRTLNFWPELPEKNLIAIECICTQAAEHRRRIETRKRNIKGWYELNWADVTRAAANYTPLVAERLVLDTADNRLDITAKALRYVSGFRP